MVYYQLTHPKFRSRVVQVVPRGVDLTMTSMSSAPGMTDHDGTRSGVTQAEIHAHLAWYPNDERLPRQTGTDSRDS